MRLALIGPRGAGKTRIAPDLARHYHCPYFDLDEAIEEVVGEALRSFIERAGWQAFRVVELETFARLLRAENFVLACGAGLIENPAARRLLLEATEQRLWLDLEPEQQAARLAGQERRPRLHPQLALDQEFTEVDALRRTLYSELASHRIDASDTLPNVIAACLCA
jgi:shikimate kinase